MRGTTLVRKAKRGEDKVIGTLVGAINSPDGSVKLIFATDPEKEWQLGEQDLHIVKLDPEGKDEVKRFLNKVS